MRSISSFEKYLARAGGDWDISLQLTESFSNRYQWWIHQTGEANEPLGFLSIYIWERFDCSTHPLSLSDGK